MGSKARGLRALTAAGLTLIACGNRQENPGRPRGAASSQASASASAAGSASPVGPAAASGDASATPASSGSAAAGDDGSPSGVPLAAFEPARGVKECKATTVDVAQYQQRGQVVIAGRKDRVAVSWLVQLAGKRQEQVAFATFDPDAKQAGRARGVGLSEHTASRAFSVGGEWTIAWFDERGFAYTHPREEPLPAPEIQHLPAVGPGEDDAVAINYIADEGLVVAAVLPSNQDQVALFRFAPADASAPGVKALGVTHHAKAPHHPGVAADKNGVTVAWLEADNRIAGTHFDTTGKETDPACTIAPAAAGERGQLSLVSTSAGTVAIWIEGTSLRARGLDPKGCPASPVYAVGEGTWPRAIAAEDAVVLAWVSPQGKLVAAKLDPKGKPSDKGLEIADAVGGVKDGPSVAMAGARAAFAWTEPMGPAVATRRIVLRTIDFACLP